MQYIQDYNNYIFGYDEIEQFSNDMVLEIFSDINFLSIFIKNNYYFTLEESEEFFKFLKTEEFLNEGFKNFAHNIINKVKNTPAVINHGLKMAGKHTVNAIKTVGKGINKVGQKIAEAAKAVKDFIVVILKEFDKAYLFFTKGAEKDIKIAATWTLKRYENVAKAAKKAKKEERQYFEDVIKYFDGLLEKIKGAFKSGVQTSIKESLLSNENFIIDLLNEDFKTITKKVATKVNNTLHSELHTDKPSEAKSLPKGTIGKLKDAVITTVNKVIDIIDVIEKNITDVTITGFAHGLKSVGGPQPPKDGFHHTSLVYTFSGIHSQGSILGGGAMKNWKRTLGALLRHGGTKGAAAIGAIAASPISIIGIGIGAVMKIIQICKKIQVTAMILRMSHGDEKMENIKKRDIKDFSGGKKYFDKNAE